MIGTTAQTRQPRRNLAAVVSNGSADRRIRAFLAGEGDGEDVLNALYNAPMGEPIPPRLRDILKR